MKGYGLLVAAALLAALSGVLYWSNHRKPAADTSVKASADTPPKILDLKPDDISKLEIKKKSSDDVELSKDASGKWQIVAPKAYRADASTVSSMISTLSSLNSDRLLEEKASNPAQYGLAPAEYEIAVTGRDNTKHTLLLGDDAPAGNDAYAALAGDPRVFMIASYSKTSIEKSLSELRDKRLLAFDSDKLSRVELDAKKQQIEFGRNKDQWQIVKPKPYRADSLQVEDLLRKLSDAKMDLSVSADDQKKAAASFAVGTAVATAKVTDATGTQELQVRKNKNDYYAKSSAVEGAYKVGSDLGTALDKGADDFRTRKLFDFGFSDPDKIEFHDGAKSYFLTKGGQDWWLADGKKADAIPAESFVQKVRDLSASKFIDSGFAGSAMDVTTTSNSGKSVEKVSIAKSGDQYVAKRENEPALYRLDKTAVEDLQKAAADLKPVPEPTLPAAKSKK